MTVHYCDIIYYMNDHLSEAEDRTLSFLDAQHHGTRERRLQDEIYQIIEMMTHIYVLGGLSPSVYIYVIEVVSPLSEVGLSLHSIFRWSFPYLICHLTSLLIISFCNHTFGY